MLEKSTEVLLEDLMFDTANDTLTLEMEFISGEEVYDMTSKTVTAIFYPNMYETTLLPIVDGVVSLEMKADYLKYGVNKIQLYIRNGEFVDPSPIMRWEILRALKSELPSDGSVDIITDLINQVTSAVDSLATVQTACETAQTGAELAESNAEYAYSNTTQALAEVTDARVSAVKSEIFLTLDARLEDIETDVSGNSTGLAEIVPYNIDKTSVVFGQEYLSAFHKKIMARTTNNLLAVFSGDSTTAGDGTTTPFHLDTLFGLICTNKGLNFINTANNGHSGAWTTSWASTYVMEDLALNPDLLVVRWGLNDANIGLNISAYETALRSGLTTIRASRALDSLSILLMTPNNVDSVDYPEKNPAWGRAINAMLRDVARDFQCCFIDTFGIWRDATNASDWMDSYLVHPQDVMNLWISSVIFNTVLPVAIAEKYKVATNIPAVNTPALLNSWVNYDASTQPAGYYKDSNNIVHLQGLIKGGSTVTQSTIFTLPVGFRPAKTLIFVSLSGTSLVPAQINITPNGNVLFVVGTNIWMVLDEISFLAV